MLTERGAKPGNPANPMEHFEYVMVLISIVIGLGIDHILLGPGGLVDRLTGTGDRLKLSIAHGAWTTHAFLWLLLFLLVAIPARRDLGRVDHRVLLLPGDVRRRAVPHDGAPRPAHLGRRGRSQDFFLRRRAWFYSVWIMGNLLDVLDWWLKGGLDYIWLETGPWMVLWWFVAIVVAALGIRSRSMRFHAAAGVALLVVDFVVSIGSLPRLGA